jgi:uncharacterized protein
MNAETANRRVDLGNSVISLVFGLLAALVFASTTGAASFDCSKARAPDERAICEDRELNDQDVRVAVLYQTTSHFLAMGARDEARAQQARWLAERQRCGANRACLSRVYAQRLAELEQIMDKAYALGPL